MNSYLYDAWWCTPQVVLPPCYPPICCFSKLQQNRRRILFQRRRSVSYCSKLKRPGVADSLVSPAANCSAGEWPQMKKYFNVVLFFRFRLLQRGRPIDRRQCRQRLKRKRRYTLCVVTWCCSSAPSFNSLGLWKRCLFSVLTTSIINSFPSVTKEKPQSIDGSGDNLKNVAALTKPR